MAQALSVFHKRGFFTLFTEKRELDQNGVRLNDDLCATSAGGADGSPLPNLKRRAGVCTRQATHLLSHSLVQLHLTIRGKIASNLEPKKRTCRDFTAGFQIVCLFFRAKRGSKRTFFANIVVKLMAMFSN